MVHCYLTFLVPAEEVSGEGSILLHLGGLGSMPL